MKKILFSALLALGLMSAVSTASAQSDLLDALPPYKIGVVAGLNVSHFAESPYNDGKLGFHIGVNALFDASELLNNTYFRTQLLLNRKGAKVNDDVKFRTVYLELPVRYGYAYAINGDWTVMAETGPYLALGLGGRVRWEEGSNDVSCKFFTNEYLGDDDPNNFDFGWGLHFGALFQQHHELSAGWDWGFVKLNDVYGSNRNFMISYGYYF